MHQSIEDKNLPYKPKDARLESLTLRGAYLNVGKYWRHLVEQCFQACVTTEVGFSIEKCEERGPGLRFIPLFLDEREDQVNSVRVVWDYIRRVETLSCEVCPICGAKASTQFDGATMRTRCPTHKPLVKSIREVQEQYAYEGDW